MAHVYRNSDRCARHDIVNCTECTKPFVRDTFSTDMLESDDSLRARLMYIGVSARELGSVDLDKLAEQYRLKRRRTTRLMVGHDPGFALDDSSVRERYRF